MSVKPVDVWKSCLFASKASCQSRALDLNISSARTRQLDGSPSQRLFSTVESKSAPVGRVVSIPPTSLWSTPEFSSLIRRTVQHGWYCAQLSHFSILHKALSGCA